MVDHHRWESYTAWDSGVTKVDGLIADNQKMKVCAAIAEGRAFWSKLPSIRPVAR